MKAEWIGNKQEEKWDIKIDPVSYSEFCIPRLTSFISIAEAKKPPNLFEKHKYNPAEDNRKRSH